MKGLPGGGGADHGQQIGKGSGHPWRKNVLQGSGDLAIWLTVDWFFPHKGSSINRHTPPTHQPFGSN
jgi:hypothetical protein